MRFSIRTVMVFMTAAAVFGLFLRTPAIVAISMCIALPALIAVVGLTSPQHGTALDPAARPVFLDLVRLWIFLAVGMAALFVVGLLNPSLSQDLARWRRGDLGMHYFSVVTDLSLEEIGTATRNPRAASDEDGHVGEIRDIDPLRGGQTRLFIRTVREEYSEGSRFVTDAQVREDGTILFRSKQLASPIAADEPDR